MDIFGPCMYFFSLFMLYLFTSLGFILYQESFYTWYYNISGSNAGMCRSYTVLVWNM